MPYANKNRKRRMHLGIDVQGLVTDPAACGLIWQATTRDPNEVTCGNCKRTMDYREAVDGKMG